MPRYIKVLVPTDKDKWFLVRTEREALNCVKEAWASGELHRVAEIQMEVVFMTAGEYRNLPQKHKEPWWGVGK